MCGSPELEGVRRLNCRAPYKCCCPGPRPEHELNEHGSPLSQALSLGTTVVQTPTPQKPPLPQTPDTPYEVPPPTPGSKVEKDPVHLWAGTPRRTEPKTGTPSDRAFKKSGNAASNPHVVPEWLPEEAEEGEEDQE